VDSEPVAAISLYTTRMLSGSDPTPWDVPLLVLLIVLAAVLAAGIFFGVAWPPAAATTLRRGSVVVAVIAFTSVHIATPSSSGIVGTGRLLTIWPVFALDILLFAVWTWRVGRL
jgi:hypothetical protein